MHATLWRGQDSMMPSDKPVSHLSPYLGPEFVPTITAPELANPQRQNEAGGCVGLWGAAWSGDR